MNYERLLLDHLDVIDQIVRTAGRRRHFSSTEQEDFASFVRLRFVENDYAVLRKFQNRSSLWTYLAAVIERMSLDFCIDRWGRWRPSTMADRLGPVAALLERLVSRDNHTLEEAMEIARTNHAVALSYPELRTLWDQLPVRMRTSEVSEEDAVDVPAIESAETRIEEAEHQKTRERLDSVLKAAFEEIAVRDRVLLALRFDQDLPMAEIAKLTGSSVPTLHRRLDKAVKHLRQALSLSGFSRAQLAEFVGHPTITLSPLLRAEVEKFLGPGRLSKRDG